MFSTFCSSIHDYSWWSDGFKLLETYSPNGKFSCKPINQRNPPVFSAIFTVQSLSHLLLPFEGISWFVRGTHDSIDFLFGFFHHPAIGASWLWWIRKGGNSPKKAQEKHECKIRVFLVRNCGYWKVWSSISILTVMSRNHSSWCSLLHDILLKVSMQIKYELCSRKKWFARDNSWSM